MFGLNKLGIGNGGGDDLEKWASASNQASRDIGNFNKEDTRVKGVRTMITDMAEKALSPDEQKLLFKTKLGKDDFYCSTRSCELERSAGTTVPKDMMINNRQYKAGDLNPVVPGTRQWASNADKFGFEQVPFANKEAGDRVFWGSKPSDVTHSMIYGGNDQYYYDDGSGDNYHMSPNYAKNNIAFRYVGNTPALREQALASQEALRSIPTPHIGRRGGRLDAGADRLSMISDRDRLIDNLVKEQRDIENREMKVSKKNKMIKNLQMSYDKKLRDLDDVELLAKK